LLSSTIPTAGFSLSSGILRPRSGGKPGLVIGDFDRIGYPNYGRVGRWEYSIRAAVRVGTRTVSPVTTPVRFIRFDDTRASIEVRMVPQSRSIIYGQTAAFEAFVYNNSSFHATGCELFMLENRVISSRTPGKLSWRATLPSAGWNTAFNVPAGGRVKIRGAFKPDLVEGRLERLGFNVVCINAPSAWASNPDDAILDISPY
jgi:hypothetical protein